MNIVTFITITLLSASTAFAAACNDTEKAEEQLTKKYKEVVQGYGVVNGRNLFKLWVNEETGTFTATVTYPNTGKTCVVSAGNRFTELSTDTGA